MGGSSAELFYSYSHRDEQLRDELEKHLSILKRQGVLSGWHDRRITAGDEWAGEIDSRLNSAAIILLLVSSDFLASDYCYDVELQRAMERHERGDARVIPIILRPVDWTGAPFARLQALPKDGKPVTSWGNLDEAFVEIATSIRAIVKNSLARQPTTVLRSPGPPPTEVEPLGHTPRSQRRTSTNKRKGPACARRIEHTVVDNLIWDNVDES